MIDPEMRDTLISDGGDCWNCHKPFKAGDEIVWKERRGSMYLWMGCAPCAERAAASSLDSSK